MLTITPKINTNSNFKAAPPNLCSLREQIAALTKEEVPKDTHESSAFRNLFKRLTKIILKYKLKHRNSLFKRRRLKVVNRKYTSDGKWLMEIHYQYGAYRKYYRGYVDVKGFDEDGNFFNGMIRQIASEKLPDGTIKYYEINERSTLPTLTSKILPDGTK